MSFLVRVIGMTSGVVVPFVESAIWRIAWEAFDFRILHD
jgi:hypothetical protein